MNGVGPVMSAVTELVRQECLVGGRWCVAEGTLPVHNPANGECLGTVPDFGAQQTVEAIDVACSAWEQYRKTTAQQRAEWLSAWAALILDRVEELAQLLTAEQGKPLAEARGEVAFGASYVRWFAEEAVRARGELIPSHWPDKRILVSRAPVGVVGAVTPWNFPSAMVTRKVAPALAAGCTVVLKPSELTPFSALALGELALEAGFPPGVFNLITGHPDPIGKVLCSDPRVRKLSFTGSTRVGKLLYAQCGDTVKRLSLELGGNAPFLVFEDADLERAVEGAMASKFRNTGQTCVCANRFLVQKKVTSKFGALLGAAVKKLKVGPGTETGVEQGPLINQSALAKVERLLADALGCGATIQTGGKPHSLGGTFFEPTVVAGVTPEMRLFQEEIFGPVAPIIEFETEAEAIRLANQTEYGLAAYAYTRDLGRAFRLSEELDYGMVGINEGIVTAVQAPFGGVKQSGLGREGSHLGLDEFLDVKYTLMGLS